jgi:hypothetical protein
MEGRTNNDVENRWNSSLKRRIERIEPGEPEFKKTKNCEEIELRMCLSSTKQLQQ